MKDENTEKQKTSYKWCNFQKDYGNLIEDCISFKVYMDNHLQWGELTKYSKDSSSILAVAPTPYQMKHNNAVFARVDAITKGRRMGEFIAKREQLATIEQI